MSDFIIPEGRELELLLKEVQSAVNRLIDVNRHDAAGIRGGPCDVGSLVADPCLTAVGARHDHCGRCVVHHGGGSDET